MSILRPSNWKQAAAEVLLIVVGILIALFADSQWELRQARQEEAEILAQILESLKSDQDYLKGQLGIAERRLQRMIELREHVSSEEPYTTDLDQKFRSMRGWLVTQATTAPYEDLKARGLGLVSDGDLRQELITYYDRVLPRVEARDQIDQEQALSEQQPYARTRFQFGGTPLNYEELIVDPEFLYLLDHRINSTRNQTVPVYEEVIRSNESLVSSIERVLAGPND